MEKILGAGLFATSIAGHLLRARQITASHRLASKSKYSMPAAPVAAKIDEIVYFGVNPKNKEEYRGKEPMNPPKVKKLFMVDEIFVTLRADSN